VRMVTRQACRASSGSVNVNKGSTLIGHSPALSLQTSGEPRPREGNSRMNPDSVEERSLPPLFDVGALWITLWQRRLVVLATAAAVFVLALAYLAVTTPTYTATASLLIDPRDTRSTNLNDVLPGIG